MFKQFLSHFEKEFDLNKDQKILLAISGGLDSRVMLDLFSRASIPVGVAHVNFQLRGQESKEDEEFVRKLCEDQRIPFFVNRVETARLAKEMGKSIQEVARQERYAFFHQVLDDHHFHRIATAHHLNDSLETVLFNLIRGTGLEGLTGIKVRHGKVIRPLLFATRENLEAYAREKALVWRTDSSNRSVKYARNLIRNEVIPLLKKINPSLEESFRDTEARLQGIHDWVRFGMEKFIPEWTETKGDKTYFKLDSFQAHSFGAVLLWEWIKDKGFNDQQCRQALLGNTGNIFYSTHYQLSVDRNRLILEPIRERISWEKRIEKGMVEVEGKDEKLFFEAVGKAQFQLDVHPDCAQLDGDNLKYPLVWRSWRAGDRFQPLGMVQHKKLSDFFVDQKVPLPQKSGITILESAGEIVWVVGYRISEKYKVAEKTDNILKIRRERIHS